MAGQSLAMGEAFGKGFQYGKRKISSLSNEEFNKLDAVALGKGLHSDINDMISTMKSSMKNFAMLQQDIIKELISYVQETTGILGEEIIKNVKGVKTDFDNFFGIPPTAAKLASPAGIAALRAWWAGINFTPRDRNDIRRQLLVDFHNNQAIENYIAKLEFLINLTPATPSIHEGPGGATGTPPDFKDPRADENKPDAPDSIVTAWKKLREEKRFLERAISDINGVFLRMRGAGVTPPASQVRSRDQYKERKQAVILELRALTDKWNLSAYT